MFFYPLCFLDIYQKNARILAIMNDQEIRHGFTSFAELELEFESLNLLFGSIFAYMPANVEIIKPEKLTLTNTDLSDLTGKLTGRLHDYDAITKKAMTEREMLVHKLKEVAPHLFKQPEPAQEAKQEDKKPRSVKKKKEKAKIN